MASTQQETFGLSLGSDSLIISVVQDGNASIVVNSHGSRATPAVVAFSEGEVVVGDTAKVIGVKRAREVVHSLPFVLSNSKNVDKVRSKKLGFDLHVEGDEIVGLITQAGMDPETPTVTHSFVDAFTPLFKFGKEEVEAYLGNAVMRCVLTLPEELCDQPSSIEKLARAAKNAGLEIDRIVRPSSAVLLTKPEVSGATMIVDMGGLGTSITTCTVEDNLVSTENVSYCGVGGRDFDEIIAKYFAEEFRRKSRLDVNDDRRAKRKLLAACEVVKRTLSVRQQGSVTIEALCDGVDYSGNITKSRFDGLAGVLLPRIKEAVCKCLKESSFENKKLSTVLLVGGGSANNLVKTAVDGALKECGCDVTSSVINQPQEVAAFGAATQADLCCLSGVGVPVGSVWQMAGKGTAGKEVDPVGMKTLVTKLVHAVGVMSASGAVKEILAAGTLLPCEGKLPLPVAGKTSVLVHIVEIRGEEKVSLCKLPVEVKGNTISITAAVASSGEMAVTCSGGAKKVTATVSV